MRISDLTCSSGTDFDDLEFGFKEEDKSEHKVCHRSLHKVPLLTQSREIMRDFSNL
jgi:hypothetical protein